MRLLRWTWQTKRRVLTALAVFCLLTSAVWWFSLPKPLFKVTYSTVLETEQGQLLSARIADDGQWRLPPQSTVPQRFRQALLEYEDRRFESHHGIDAKGVTRAIYQNIKNRRIVSGASTLSMQVIRLSRGREGNRFANKLVEILLAPRLELSYSKDDILALYAAHAPFGGNVVGLQAASWRYFGRDASQLSWAEACTLAVLPNSPALVHPGRSRDLLHAKRDRLLQRLHERGVLSELDLQLALAEPLIAEPHPLPQAAPHLLATLHAERPNEPRIVTTIDADLQRIANGLVARHAERMRAQQIHNAAMVVIDNRDFVARAYVGNTPNAMADAERGHYVDIIHRPRSTGSILKPFLYAAMLQSGDLLPHMLIPDVPTQIAGYTPENFDRQFRGAVPANEALALSLNVPAVRMLRSYGVPRFYDALKQVGLTTLNRQPDDYGLTLVLGGAEGNLWDIAGGYANLVQLARDTSPNRPASLQTVRVGNNDRHQQRTATDFGAGSAWLTLSALLDVQRPADESHWRELTSGRPIAWKTGTSWGMRDAWAVGSSSRYTVAVWVGNATGEGRAGLTGALAAAPLLFEMFQRLPNDAWIATPRWDLKNVHVCRNDGYLVNGDCEESVDTVPRTARVELRSPNNRLVHLDRSERYRVDSSCETIDSMRHRSWFVLPPAQEFFYRRMHANYQPLPKVRRDCLTANAMPRDRLIDFIYPAVGTKVYIPMEFGAKQGRAIFEAVHREPEAKLYWHIDNQYLGATQHFHQMEILLAPGAHNVTVVDEHGSSESRKFEVLGTKATLAAVTTAF
jgi:penicillin-binding protein 1C